MSWRGGSIFLCFVAALIASAAWAENGAAEPVDPPTAEAPAADVPAVPVNSLSLMVGVYTTSFWARSFSVGNVGYEPNFVLAVISGRDLLTTSWGLRIGHESGLAIRFGADFSVEMWQGLTVSFGARLLGGMRLTPELVLGLSTITNPIGVEVPREGEVENGDMDRLVYLGSHLAYMFEAFPYVSAFYRLHHRSGALGFWGNLPDGHNANSIGFTLRY